MFRPPFRCFGQMNNNMSPYQRAPQKYHQPRNFYYNNNQSLDFWCDTCDKGFGSQFHLDKHKSQHQKCNIDGCQFVAHPKVITRHIQMQHSTGLYNRIAKSQDPEEIKKWREERKERYPTKANIEKKNAVFKEKMDRGEKMELNKRKNYIEPNTNRKSSQKFPPNRRHDFNKHKNRHRKAEKPKVVKLVPDENNKKLKPFAGIKDLLVENELEEEQVTPNYQIEDDEWISEPNSNTKKNNVCNALLTILSNYDSDDEQDGLSSEVSNKGNDIKCTFKSDLPIHNNNANNMEASDDDSPPVEERNVKLDVLNTDVKRPCKIVNHNMETSDDDGPPDEEKNFKIDVSNIDVKTPSKSPPKPSKIVKQTQIRKPPLNRPKFIKKQIPSTLLQKLLSKEIKQERNKILQCVRHIVKNNFFEKK